MNRECEACVMEYYGFRLDYFDPGNGIHLGQYRCKYTSPKGKKLWLWHCYLCQKCKANGTIPSRNIFTAPVITIEKKENKCSCFDKCNI